MQKQGCVLSLFSRPSPGLQPATRRWRAFVMPSFGPPCIHEAHFRHRGASVSGFLRPSATVAAWRPGPAAPVLGKASIPPGVVSTGSGAAVCLDLSGFVSACVHPCPENGTSPNFSARSSASTGPASFLADPDHTSVSRKSNKMQKEAATASLRLAVAAVAAPPTVSPNSPPTHQR